MTVKSQRREREPMLRGVLFTLRRKCGKPSCRCAEGELHESPALAYPAGGRTKTMTLTETDIAVVQGALERYRLARAEIDGAADAEIAAMRAAKSAQREQRRG
ncbi:MAG: DUF6788 family protein [Marmoricola sp.]